jgi:hypothetical protein
MADINLSIGAVVEERSYKQAMSKIRELGLQGAREGHEGYLQKQIKTLQTRKPTADTARIIKNLQKQLNDVDAIYKWINNNSPKTISMGASYNNNLPALPLKTSVLNNKITGLNVKKHPNDRDNLYEKDLQDIVNSINGKKILSPIAEKNAEVMTLNRLKSFYKQEYVLADALKNKFGGDKFDNPFLTGSEEKGYTQHLGRKDAAQYYTQIDERIKALKQAEKTAREHGVAKEPQKVVTQEQKSQNRELTDSIFKLSKILALWHLIRKAINNIAKGIKFVNNESQVITSRDIKEKGIFSIDAYSAMRANTDKTGAMIGRGLAFMGPSAPFSMTSFNDTVKSLQELRNKAMSGQGIQDEQQIISLQRISDSLGLGYNVASLMSNPNIDLTDFVKDLMRSVEEFLPKLDTLDDIKKSLLTSDFIKALGPELIDAISYNYNLNQRTGETASVIEKVLAAGAGAHAPIDFTVEANNLKTTMTTLNGKFDLLKQALENLFAGPLADFINNRVVPKVDDVSDAAIRNKLRQSSSPYIQAMGWAKAEAAWNTKNREAYEADEKQQLNWLKENRVKFSDEMNSLYNKVATGGTLTQNEALQALLMPYAQSSNFGSTIESLALASIGQNLLKRFEGRTPKDVLKNGKISVDEKKFLGVMDKNIPITQATISAATGSLSFLEGGLADWDPQKYGTNYEDYLRTAITALGYDYNSVLASMLTDPAFATNSNVFKEVSWTNDANKDKIIDSYITIKLVDTNNHTSYVRTKITDDMKQTFAAELH